MHSSKYILYTLLLIIGSTTIIEGQKIEISDYNIDQIDSIFLIKEGVRKAGIASIIHLNDKPIYQKTFGYSNLEHKVPLNSKTKLQVGAFGKYVIGFATFLAEDQGHFSLEDNITKYFDNLNIGKEIKIKHLLGHTSGFHDVSYLKSLASMDDSNILTFDQLLGILSKQTRLDNKPGTKYRYRDINLILLAEIISRATEVPFAEFAQLNIFSPLKMDNSGFLSQPKLMIKDAASSYIVEDDMFKKVLEGNSFISPTNFISSSNDLEKLIRNMFTKSIGTKDIYKRMDQIVTLNNGEEVMSDVISPMYGQLLTYNYGKIPVIYQYSSASGFCSTFYYFPEANFSSLVVTNTSESYNGSYCWKTGETILSDYFSTNPSNFSLQIDNTEPYINSIEKYTGDYWNEDKARLRKIIVKNDTLRSGRRNLIRIGENKFQMETAYSVIFDFEIKENEKLLSITSNDSAYPDNFLKAFPNKSSANLKDYNGSYYSDQLDVELEVKIIDDQLNLIHPLQGEIPLHHLNKDMFTSNVRKFDGIHFFRNQNKEITKLEISNTYAKHIIFSKSLF